MAAWRSVMKQNFLEPTTKPKVTYINNSLEFGINLWSSPWNYWEVYVGTLPFKKIWDCWIAVCWIEVKSFALLLQSTNQRSKSVETTKKQQFKIKWDYWIAVRCKEEGTFAKLLQLTTWRRMDSMMNCNYLRKHQRKDASTNRLSRRILFVSLKWISLQCCV